VQWITYLSGDRARLNEKAVFLTTHLVLFGIFRAAIHLIKDTDRLFVGAVTRTPAGSAPPTGDPATSLKRFYENLPVIFVDSLSTSTMFVIPSTLTYAILLRAPVWRITLAFMRPFFNLPKSNMLPPTGPYQWTLMLRCLWAGTLLSFLWMMGNTAFSIFLVKEPLKNGKPLTSEAKDPNGSLLNGLKSKKDSIKSFALWELGFIARDFEDRRKAIYQDIGRRDGPMWSQVCKICLDLVNSLESRIDSYGKPPPTTAVTKPEAVSTPNALIAKTVKEDPIAITTPKKASFRSEIEKAVANAVTDPTQEPRLSPLAQRAMAEAKDKLSEGLRGLEGGRNPSSKLQTSLREFLAYPIGQPFRQPFRRRLTAAVLGKPYGEPSLYINAATAVSLLAAHSLTEDSYGNVQRDVAGIIRALTSTTKKLESFKAGFPKHWADMDDDRSSPEVDAVLNALKDGLQQLIDSFGPYSQDLRLSRTDMRLAREAATRTVDENEADVEMAQIQ
jgi:nucleoporin NDC1